MLVRNPTRIEFKPEDAQEYAKSRERQRKQALPITGVAGSSGLGHAMQSLGGLSSGGACVSNSPIGSTGPAMRESSASPGGPGGGTVSSSGQGTPVLHSNMSDASPQGAGSWATPPRADRATAAPTAAAASAAAAAATSAAAYQPQVEQLTAMGFTVDQARQALHATGGDVEAAADWLLS
eukprot:gnl/TRDRNA2_/TRDRNA2_45189_c1_seq1.p1 gnl/TRDRNA2_/TRDRNA2_45189_c1~~gnl/TRDRNA2_/TRDRNA2_45189_c1_seq1.p1  ORF type:complete len:180 (+),score=35.68 gnl/TRDRNA2_/TRDRNA2_45189_c1_seq1:97-636(+)